ncbi:MAG: glycoside hydrolase family 3 C-terminal domain-containing protein [Comamonadaceae bacterium]|nr:glycoside hydrolase family 3 C-terminal domain-containing protein [Comamonadaceae bacterium]
MRLDELPVRVAPKAHLDQALRGLRELDDARPERGRGPAALGLAREAGRPFAQQRSRRLLRRPGLRQRRCAKGSPPRPPSTPTATRTGGRSTRPSPRPRPPRSSVVALFSRLADGKGTVGLAPAHVELIRRLAAVEKGPAVVVVSFGSPYFLRHFPEVEAYVCMYRATAEAQIVAARALSGELDVAGRLPVSIPDLYPIGHGLELKRRTP